MRMQAFHLSSQGASHIKKNKECQDASDSYYGENCAIAIVCDGHGGDDYVRSHARDLRIQNVTVKYSARYSAMAAPAEHPA